MLTAVPQKHQAPCMGSQELLCWHQHFCLQDSPAAIKLTQSSPAPQAFPFPAAPRAGSSWKVIPTPLSLAVKRQGSSSQHLPSVQLLPVQPASHRHPAVQTQGTGITDNTKTSGSSKDSKSGACAPVSEGPEEEPCTHTKGGFTASLSPAAKCSRIPADGTPWDQLWGSYWQ